MAGAAFDALQERILPLAWHGSDPAAGRDGDPMAGRDWLQLEMYPTCGPYGDPGREAGYAPGPAGPRSAAVEDAFEVTGLRPGGGGIWRDPPHPRGCAAGGSCHTASMLLNSFSFGTRSENSPTASTSRNTNFDFVASEWVLVLFTMSRI